MAAKNPLESLNEELEAIIGEREERPRPAAPRAKTVLLVDDNADYRKMVSSLLRERALEVLEAGDGKEGLKLVMSRRPDLVIVDFNMPEMNGYEFIQEVKSLFELRRTPIIMFSGAANRRHIKEIGLDVVAFLEKPLSNARLLASVMASLGVALPAPAVPVPEAAPETPPAAEPPACEPPAELWTEGNEALEVEMVQEEAAPQEAAGLETVANDSPLITRVNKILVKAVEMRASDIHIEPQELQTNVRIRIDGALKALCSLPAALHARLAARLKIMSNLIITEHRLPQDGQFRVQIKGQKIEFRVSTVPSAYGEKVVLRVLGQSKLMGDLSRLGLGERDLGAVEAAVRSPNGLILVTGPTGSGKTTTLYTMLGAINGPEINIMTVEDPIEYRLAGITQVHVQAGIGLTFESVLRAFLRQDPNVMLVGEVRDKETADIAVKASITGHLVLSTLHTNGAAATIARLTHMGVAPYLVAASVRTVIAQRLIRLLCANCKLRAPVSDEAKRCLSEEEVGRLKDVYRAAGCQACGQSGFLGRRPVFEVMPVRTPEMRQAITGRGEADLISDLAVKEGMTSLRQAALTAIVRGETSMSEGLKIMMTE